MRREVKRVFIIGAPRSGSTWLTSLLAQHPSIVTCQHLKLFDYLHYLDRWYQWKANFSFVVAPGPAPAVPGLGRTVSHFLPPARRDALLRDFARGVLDSLISVRPGVSVVVDKTPENALRCELILRVFPDAYMLHVVRDPRSVFCSQRAASRSWAPWEFPTRPVDGAKYWLEHLDGAREAAKLTERYLEIRYEDLKENGPATLQQIHSWLGLVADKTACRRAVELCSKDYTSQITELPKGFVRHPPGGGWQEELSSSNARVIEYLAGDRMIRAGYRPRLKPFAYRPLRIRLRELGDSWLGFFASKSQRFGSLIHWWWVGRKLEWPWP